MSIYDLSPLTADGSEAPLSQYKGKLLLIVNTATACGFTPQYKGLQELYDKYRNSGFEILDFPCNQFKGQAPGTDEEINSFCELHFHTTFPRFKKIEVNGANESPLYTWLKSQKGEIFGGDIEWNFAKFLIGRDGEALKRYAPAATAADIEKDVAKLLEA
jgi:glutathione peroxidase